MESFEGSKVAGELSHWQKLSFGTLVCRCKMQIPSRCARSEQDNRDFQHPNLMDHNEATLPVTACSNNNKGKIQLKTQDYTANAA